MSKLKTQKNKLNNTKQRSFGFDFLNFELPRKAFFAKNAFRGGFSIIESLIAISILLTAIAAPMSMAQNGLVLARNSTNQITAFYLGQEAVEFVRYQRDTNVFDLDKNKNWLKKLSNCVDKGKPCIVDVLKGGMKLCSSGICEKLKISPEGLYGHEDTWMDSIFTRSVLITETVPDREVLIEVTVKWTNTRGDKEIKINETLFNWQ